MTIIDALRAHAVASSDSPAFTFMSTAGEEATITFNELDLVASAIACRINKIARAGDRVILCYPPGLDYVCVFFGCLYAGVIAVPLYPPRRRQRSDRIAKVVSDCNSNLMLIPEKNFSSLNSFFEESSILSNIHIMVTDEVMGQTLSVRRAGQGDEPSCATPPCWDEEEIAFLQYTSGSTGSPKGVMVSHSNIISNVKALQSSLGCQQQDVYVNWLPLFHDMGLVVTVLLPVYLGAHSILMAPSTFVRQPGFWLSAISKYKGTMCGAPNFAYDLCVDRCPNELMDQLDLSSWRIAFNSAEPINSKTLTRFYERFKSVGFSFEAFYPSYGMAEITVFAAGGVTQEAPIITSFDKMQIQQDLAVQCEANSADSVSLVSCGRAAKGHDIKIVDTVSLKALPEGQIGEIWLRGPSIARGYWASAERTREVFQACTADSEGENYLRSGDKGFFWKDELYIAGRIKDLIIINGVNYYPQDIEWAARSAHPAVNSDSCAAFSTTIDNVDYIVIVMEVLPRYLKGLRQPEKVEEVFECVKTAVLEEQGLYLHQVVLIKPTKISKTTSGKIQRSESKSLYENNMLEELYTSSPDPEPPCVYHDIGGDDDNPLRSNPEHQFPEGELEMLIAQVFCETLEINNIGAHQNFFAMGGDSILAITAASSIQERGFDIAVEDILEFKTIRELAKEIENRDTQKNKNTSEMDKAFDLISKEDMDLL